MKLVDRSADNGIKMSETEGFWKEIPWRVLCVRIIGLDRPHHHGHHYPWMRKDPWLVGITVLFNRGKVWERLNFMD